EMPIARSCRRRPHAALQSPQRALAARPCRRASPSVQQQFGEVLIAICTIMAAIGANTSIVKSRIIMDVEASRAIRQAEVSAARTMIKRTEQRFDIKPGRLAGDTGYGSGANLNWLVNEAKIAPHIPVVDKSKREDGTFSREDFTFDKERNVYICPAS